MKIAIGADHRGFAHKELLARLLMQDGHSVRDCGGQTPGPVDYPDPAVAVAQAVAGGECERGILVCGSGIGVSIAANKVDGVRAALCADLEAARASRRHNDANVLCLSGDRVPPPLAGEMARAWLSTAFEGGRHGRRVAKIGAYEAARRPAAAASAPAGAGRTGTMQDFLRRVDPEIAAVVARELARQRGQLEMIASENFTSPAVLAAMSSVLTNKYAEGYPGKRYYGGCEHVDEAEELARRRACALFGADHANVQPHSGSTANMSAYLAFLKPGDKILGLSLSHGGHLTHGHPVNFSGLLFQALHYEVDPATETIDYDRLRAQALRERPKLIIGGASAYPRFWDFAAMRSIADECGALLLFDMAHVAGLIAGGVHPNPVPYCDVVTSTTHKTLRGPRGGLILCTAAHAKAIDKLNFPGVQGGPFMHLIAAKAVCFHEAAQPDFQVYAKRVVENARALGERLADHGFHLVSGGTDNHLLLVNVTNQGLNGKQMEALLHQVGITVNKNTVPFDQNSPFVTSGVRIGTPALTTRGMGPGQMRQIADLIARAVAAREDASALARLRAEAEELCRAFPLYADLE